MLDVPAVDTHWRYSGFISYSRHDSKQAQWLHTALERFRMPARLAGREGARGPVPERLQPLFLDRSELTAASDLTGQLQNAIAASQWMIVLCTPWAATSEWVDREVRLMQALGRGGHILPALFDGDERNAFPPALRDGDQGPVSPLAADFRPGGDGRRLATMKLVSVMTGVGLGDLVHRESHRRQRRMAGVAALSAGGMVAFAALSLFAVRAQRAAEFERERSEAMVETLITELRAAVKPLGSLSALGVINEAAARYFRGQPIEKLSDEALAQRARLLIAMGEDEVARGGMDAALTHFTEAHRTTERRLAAAPDDPARILDHATSEFWLGQHAWNSGDAQRARQAWGAYRQMTLRLLAAEPDNPDWLLEAGYAETNLGIVALRQDLDIPMAERRFETALAHYRQVLLQRPHDETVTMDLADGLAWLADTERLAEKPAMARALRSEQRALLEARLATDPNRFNIREQLAASRIALGRIAEAEGKTGEALDQFTQAEAEAGTLLLRDPDNAMLAETRRMAALFAARAMLLQGAGNAVVPDCAEPQRAISPAELEDWCHMVEARRLAMAGDGAAAARLLDSVRGRQLKPGALRLSEAFGLDFGSEAEAIRALLRAGGQPG